MFQPSPSSPLLTRRNNSQASLNQEAISTLTQKMMTKTFGELLRNYVRAVMKAIPSSDSANLAAKLSFLTDNKEITLVGLAGVDTWNTPVEKMTDVQIHAGLRALSWVTSEMVYRLSKSDQSENDLPETELTDETSYADFQNAVNSMSPLRAALLMRSQQLNPPQQYQAYNTNAASSSSGSSRTGSSFGDVFFYWNPNSHCYYYHPCYYDYHHGSYYLYSGHHHHHGWGHHHHYYGHYHSEPFPVAHALGEHVIAPTIEHTAKLFSKLFDLQVDIAQGALKLGGRAIDAMADGAGDFIGGVSHHGGNVIHSIGDGINGVAHGAGDCCEQGLRCVGHGAGEVGHCLGHVGHDLGHCFAHFGKDCCHLMSNAVGGCADVLGLACKVGGDCISCCAQCGSTGACNCKGCDGAGGDKVMEMLSAVGGCLFATGYYIGKVCGCVKSSKPDNPSPPDYADIMSNGVTDHPHYTTVTTVTTCAYWTCCGIPLIYKMGKDGKMILDSSESDRNRSAASWDCGTALMCIAGVEAAGFIFAPQYMGPRVIGNMAISAGQCARTTNYIARVHGESKDNFGVTHADKYFLTAQELNDLIANMSVSGAQSGRDDEVSRLDVVLRQNTGYYNQAVEGKNHQNSTCRRWRNFISCGGYGFENHNRWETERAKALDNINAMKSGQLPITTAPPQYNQQSFSMN